MVSTDNVCLLKISEVGEEQSPSLTHFAWPPFQTVLLKHSCGHPSKVRENHVLMLFCPSSYKLKAQQSIHFSRKFKQNIFQRLLTWGLMCFLSEHLFSQPNYLSETASLCFRQKSKIWKQVQCETYSWKNVHKYKMIQNNNTKKMRGHKIVNIWSTSFIWFEMPWAVI